MAERKASSVTVNVNLDRWDLGDWPDLLADAVTMEIDENSKSVTFELSVESFTLASGIIAKQAIEAFLQEEAVLDLTDAGVELHSGDHEGLTIMWDDVWMKMSKEARDSLVSRLQAIKYEEDGSIEMETVGDLSKSKK